MSKRRKSQTPKNWEQKANSHRAAWNRVGKRFNLSTEELNGAKQKWLSPYPILRNIDSYNRDSVKYYIENGRFTPRQYDSLAERSVDIEIERLTEIARLEQEGLDSATILEIVGEHWW